MNIQQKADHDGFGYVLESAMGEARRVTVTREVDGSWTRPHPTEATGRVAVHDGAHVRAFTDREVAENDLANAEQSREYNASR